MEIRFCTSCCVVEVNAQNDFALTPIALVSIETSKEAFEFLSARETGKLFAERARALAERRSGGGEKATAVR